MEFTNNNDVLIVLNLKDRRGRLIRVSSVQDLKVKVWTNSPDCALTFDYRDIIQKRDEDTLLIKGSLMEALPSGVVTYSYVYRSLENFRPDHKHFDFPEHRPDPASFHSEVVVTEIFWRNMHRELVIESPTYYRTLERMRDLIDHERQDRTRQIRDIHHYVTEEYTNKLNDEVERATVKETDLDNYIHQVEEDLNKSINSKYVDLSSTIDDEVKRSNQVDVEMFNNIREIKSKLGEDKEFLGNEINSETNRAETAEAQIQENLDQEVARAKAEELRIEEKLDAEIARSRAEDTQINVALEGETTRAKGEEARLEAKIDTETSRATEAEKHIQTDIDDEVKRAKAAEENLENKQADLKTDLNEEIDRAKGRENDIKTKVDKEISRATIAEDEIKASIRINESTNKAELDRIESKINNEISRATEAEKHLLTDIEDEVSRAKARENEIESLIKNHFPASENDIKTLTDRLNAEIARSEAEDVKTNTAITVLNGDAETLGSVAHSIKDANHYTDIEIENLRLALNKLFNDTVADYVTKEQFQTRIEELIGGAPAAFDTLMELYEALQKDDDAIKVLNDLLATKADSDDVYSKTEIDRKEGDINNLIHAEEQRATLAESGLQTQVDSIVSEKNLLKETVNSHLTESAAKFTEIDGVIQSEVQRATLAENGLQSQLDSLSGSTTTLTEKVDNHISDAESKYQEVHNAILAEETRATNEETKLQNAIDVINADENQIGSIKHAEHDANHYTDDKISEVSLKIGQLEAALQELQTKITDKDEIISDLTQRLDEVEEAMKWVVYE